MSASRTLDTLLAILWDRYKQRVAYAAQYQALVEQQGGAVQNDHIAFRTFNTELGKQPAGVAGIARIFEGLGYTRQDRYIFTDKKLTAWHWQHLTQPHRPKIFISQLEVDQLPLADADFIRISVKETPDNITDADQNLLTALAKGKELDNETADALAARLAEFFIRPWPVPRRDVVQSINKTSQYAAWTLLHGNAVNHFTAYINEQKVAAWPDIETTAAALHAAGIPMKADFEGERGSKLRQSSTQAVDETCDVLEKDGKKGSLPWSYAYYELAERGDVPGPNGKPTRFQAFLGEQATNLFDMTKRS